jgi:hypothetical protein
LIFSIIARIIVDIDLNHKVSPLRKSSLPVFFARQL